MLHLRRAAGLMAILVGEIDCAPRGVEAKHPSARGGEVVDCKLSGDVNATLGVGGDNCWRLRKESDGCFPDEATSRLTSATVRLCMVTASTRREILCVKRKFRQGV